MLLRHILGIVLGGVALIAVLILGTKGIPFIALIALRPAILRWKKVKADERELSLFHKTNSITFGIVICEIVILYLLFQNQVADIFTPYWFSVFILSFVIIQSLVGFFLLKFK